MTRKMIDHDDEDDWLDDIDAEIYPFDDMLDDVIDEDDELYDDLEDE
jgi:hypothetical protein